MFSIGISVIVPAHNVEAYIAQCIESIFRQTFKNLEIIVIDDASTDRTYEVAREAYGHLPNVRIIRNDRNRGVSESRNLGMKLARGKYLYFLDSDDILLSHGLENLYNAAEKYQADIMHVNENYVPADNEFEKMDGLQIKLHREPKYMPHIYRVPHDLAERLESGCMMLDHDMVVWLNLYRRDFLLENDLFFPSVRYEDIFFGFACYCATDRIWTMPGAFYIYRQRESSFMHDWDSKRLTQSVEALFLGDRYMREMAERFIGPGQEKLVKKVRHSLLGVVWKIILRFYKGTGEVKSDNIKAVDAALEPLFGRDAYLIGTILHFAGENSKQLEKCQEQEKTAISVVMPVYNGERYLPTALDSVLSQSFNDFELLCVDDGSTDKSPQIISAYARKDSRVRLIRNTHTNVGEGRNRGLSEAKGKYVIFLDADDIFEPKLLQRLYERIEETESDICFCAANQFDDRTGKIIGRLGVNLDSRLRDKEVFSWRDREKEFFRCTTPAPWNKLYRKDFLDRSGIIFPSLHTAEDLYLSSCTLAAAERISYVEEYLVNYRSNNQGSLDGRAHEHPDDFLHSLLSIREWLLEHGLFEPLKEDYEKMAMAHCVRNLKMFSTAMQKQDFEALLARVNAHEGEIGVSFKA